MISLYFWCRRAFIVLAFCLGFVVLCKSQTKVLTVIDKESGLPMIGVHIKDELLTNSWLTDSIGQAVVNLGVNGKTLSFSMMGYQSKQIHVGIKRENHLIFLEPLVLMLKEVQLSTGYQKLNRERMTGSYVLLDSSLLNRRISTNILARIEDLSPGVLFNRHPSGNNGIDINIRGLSTINSDSQPLIVLDNFPFNGKIEDINPNDIESVTILKDAAAASIWGAKAGNGVIVLTSKESKLNQKQVIEFNVNTTLTSRPNIFQIPVMSSADYIDIERKLFDKGFYSATETSENHAALTPVIELLIAKRDHLLSAELVENEISRLAQIDVRKDFSKYLYRSGINQQYSFALRGGSTTNHYAISLGLDRNLEGLVRNDFTRSTIGVRHELAFLKNSVNWSNSINYTLSKRNNNNMGHNFHGLAGGAIYPYAEIKGVNGENLKTPKNYRENFTTYAATLGLLNWEYSILDELQSSNNSYHTDNLNLNTALKVKIFKGFTLDLLYQWNRIQNINRTAYAQDSYFTRNLINKFTIVNADQSLTRPIPLGAILDWNTGTQNNQSFRSQLNISKMIGEHSDLKGLIGFEARANELHQLTNRWYGYNDDYESSKVVDYINPYVSFVNNGSTNNLIPYIDGAQRLNDRFRSVFTNLIYTLKNKYVLSASARLDQSNLFGVNSNQKGVPLWSVGLAWNLSKEEFLKGENMPDLKLRLSYGYNGNVNKSLSAYTTAIYNNGANTQNKLVYATIQNPPNPDLRWERVRIINSGFEFVSSNKKLAAMIDVYRKMGLDLIGSSPMPPASGVIQFTSNSANTKTFGTDLSINLQQKIGNINWNSNISYSLVNEKVTAYNLPSANDRYVQNINLPREGYPLYALYAYKWAGLDPVNGDPQGYLDDKVSKNYQQIKNIASFGSVSYVGASRPTNFGAFRNTFTLIDFSFSFNISYRFGYYFRKPSIVYGNDYGMGGHGDYSMRWKEQGDELKTFVPSVPLATNALRDEFYLYSEVLVDKGDHIRLQDISVGYNLTKTLSKLKFKSVNVYGYFNNIGLIWKANKWGIDPDYYLMRPPLSVAFGLKINI